MEIRLKSSVAKQPYNNGFTLVEMLLVLFVLSMLIVLFPIMKPQKKIQLQFEANVIKEILLKTQITAMSDHQKEQIVISSNRISYLQQMYRLPNGMSCTPKTIIYTENGNVSKAGKVSCQCEGKKKQIIYELGSGAVYVK